MLCLTPALPIKASQGLSTSPPIYSHTNILSIVKFIHLPPIVDKLFKYSLFKSSSNDDEPGHYYISEPPTIKLIIYHVRDAIWGEF